MLRCWVVQYSTGLLTQVPSQHCRKAGRSSANTFQNALHRHMSCEKMSAHLVDLWRGPFKPCGRGDETKRQEPRIVKHLCCTMDAWHRSSTYRRFHNHMQILGSWAGRLSTSRRAGNHLQTPHAGFHVWRFFQNALGGAPARLAPLSRPRHRSAKPPAVLINVRARITTALRHFLTAGGQTAHKSAIPGSHLKFPPRGRVRAFPKCSKARHSIVCFRSFSRATLPALCVAAHDLLPYG